VIRQFQWGNRHRPAHHQTIEGGKHAAQLPNAKKFGEQKGVPQLLRIHQHHVCGLGIHFTSSLNMMGE